MAEQAFTLHRKLGRVLPLSPSPASPGAGVGRWADRSAGLEYQIGSRKIAEALFQARVCMTPFAELPPEPIEGDALAQLADCSLVEMFSHPVTRRLPRVAFAGNALRYVPRHYRRYSVTTAGTFNSYLETFSAKTRQTLKRKVRKYCGHVGSDAPWRQFSTRGELEEFHTLARSISIRTYQERLFDAGLPATTTFIDEIFEQGHTARGYLLLHGPVPVAYLFTPVQGDIAVYQFLGYDPRYADWSPGTVLQYFALTSMFADPAVSSLDFAEGEAPQKALFATRDTFCADIYYFRPTWRTLAAVTAHIGLRAADRLVAGALERLGLRRRLLRLIRR